MVGAVEQHSMSGQLEGPARCSGTGKMEGTSAIVFVTSNGSPCFSADMTLRPTEINDNAKGVTKMYIHRQGVIDSQLRIC